MSDAFSAIHNYRAVDDRLGTSGQPTEAQLADVARAGFMTVINLALHDDPRYSLADEAGTVRSLGLDYVHIPVQFVAPKQSELLAFFDAMDARTEEKVWMHCAANYRVTVFLGLYRMVRQGWPRERAFELMDGLWKPNDVWAAFIEEALAKKPSP
ncbi:protein tyrosine phosphatase family protein [Ramlibacter sp. WS9]|uniref:protein tyrosine phosphatase family protein n=1 Tax=Ramlibacter sp. WS9 TaxID=1882741 RepID=UPI0018EE8C5B|nr:protein tyrosine phosphatase family protein [Ramlibacter sp. WS9]